MNSEPNAEIRKVTEQDETYPKSLRELVDRPSVLYVKGRWPLPETCRIGIVGTRRASFYGLEAAQRFTIDLVRHGIVIVSGLAAGIDACAHRMTLQQGGWTVAVLGHGFGHQFPKENAPLFAEIAKQGTIVTEFSYETPPVATNFPLRNRIISGLSQGVVVIEAGMRSGASITARYAAEQGRDVFVVPGSIFSPQSQGCHRLIKEGAKLTDSVADILTEYGFEEPVEAPLAPAPQPKKEAITPAEAKLIERMSLVPISVDELAEVTAMRVDHLAEVLLSLELKGRIRAMPGQHYVTCD